MEHATCRWEMSAEKGYSRGIVNHHFATREELVKTLIVYPQHAFAVAARDASGRGLSMIALIIERQIDYLRERRPVGQAFLLVWAGAVGSEPSLRANFVQRDT